MATKKEADKDTKGKDAVPAAPAADPLAASAILMTDELRQELEELTNTQRAAVLMLLLGEQQASEIIRYMNPREVQALGAAMVSVADLSQEAVNIVLDDFVATLKKQTSLGLGTGDYVEKVLKRALGEDKAASVLSRIMPARAVRGWRFSSGWTPDQLRT